ncbi:putative uncharacterized protein [Clostridium sp. CAG:81]|jgi:hypothetical protein|nr:putative uncharacterized protein [Clostridium sp. CAG:81]
MTLGTLISKVTLLRPSEYDKDELTQWVNEVEFMAYDQVIGMAEPLFPPGMIAAKDPVTVYPVKPGDETSPTPPPEPPKPQEYEPYEYSRDVDKTLMIPDQFNGVYTSYLFSKIDFNNAEIDRYNLDATMFSSEWAAYAGWYRRTHRPKEVRHEAPYHQFQPF